MIWEIAVVGGCLWTLRQLKYHEEIKLNKNFTKILNSTREHVYNAAGETFHKCFLRIGSRASKWLGNV